MDEDRRRARKRKVRDSWGSEIESDRERHELWCEVDDLDAPPLPLADLLAISADGRSPLASIADDVLGTQSNQPRVVGAATLLQTIFPQGLPAIVLDYLAPVSWTDEAAEREIDSRLAMTAAEEGATDEYHFSLRRIRTAARARLYRGTDQSLTGGTSCRVRDMCGLDPAWVGIVLDDYPAANRSEVCRCRPCAWSRSSKAVKTITLSWTLEQALFRVCKNYARRQPVSIWMILALVLTRICCNSTLDFIPTRHLIDRVVKLSEQEYVLWDQKLQTLKYIA